MAAKVWFITGASRGFGRIWATAALQRGDKVAASARNPETLAELVATYGDAVLPLKLDVTDRAAVFAAVACAQQHFGQLDIVVNNAGYGLFGVVEDLSESEARAQMETNFFGALWVTQAALPIMREQQRGHILQVSSIGGILAWPMLSLYHASKWAMEGLSEALSQEVAAFGIRITLIEPGPYSTDWRDVSSVWESPSEPYVGLGKANRRPGSGMPQGDPAATAAAILQVVDSDSPPLRLFLGDSLTALARTKYLERIGTWEEWEPVARAAQGK